MINIIKSQPAPNCLSIQENKADGDYKCGDVLERLKNDFHNKCYICEEKEPSTINVEHFIPHQGNKQLKFDWNNLFWACGHCNNIKSHIHTNLINCTDNSQKVVDLLKFEIKPFPKEKALITALSTQQEIQSTVILLNAVYNGTTILKTIEAGNIRNKIIDEVNKFQKLLFKYYEHGLSSEKKQDIKRKIERKLSPESHFTAFKYWIINGNEELKNDFSDIL